MRKWIFLAILILLPVMASAQGVGLQWAKINYNLHDQADFRTDAALAQFGASMFMGGFRISYTFTTGCSYSNTINPVGNLIIGGTDFGDENGTTNPVRLDWTLEPSHTLDFQYSIWRNIGPLFILKRSGVSVTATGESGGDTLVDSESNKRWVYGIGAEIVAPMPKSFARLKLAGSSKYILVDVGWYREIWRSGAVGGGYRYEKMKIGNSSRLQVGAWMLGCELYF